MRPSQIFGMGALLVMSSGCAPIADNNQRHGQTPQESAAEATQSSTRDQTAPVPDAGSAAAGSSQDNSLDDMSAGESGGSASTPFIAESRTVIQVINKLSPGRLEVVEGCLTVAVSGRERATAVFSPGVKPQFRGQDMVAVSFEGHMLPLDQEAPIPGGVIRLTSTDLVKPLPPYCPKTLFGLGG